MTKKEPNIRKKSQKQCRKHVIDFFTEKNGTQAATKKKETSVRINDVDKEQNKAEDELK
jgi:hypothetical protein